MAKGTRVGRDALRSEEQKKNVVKEEGERERGSEEENWKKSNREERQI